MIAGVSCPTRNSILNKNGSDADIECRRCAYPSRLVRWIQREYDHSSILYENRATGGTTTRTALPMLPYLSRDHRHNRSVDLIIADFSVNDEGTLRNRKMAKHSAEVVFISTEAMLRYLLLNHPNSSIILVKGFCKRSLAASEHMRATSLYGVAYVDPSKTSSSYDCTNPVPHPPEHVHEKIKMGLVQWWKGFAHLSLSRDNFTNASDKVVPPLNSVGESNSNVCFEPLSMFDPLNMYMANFQSRPLRSDTPLVSQGNWRLSLDNGRSDRAAWISTEDKSVIEFPVTFGSLPRATIVYTMGYDDTFGDIEVCILLYGGASFCNDTVVLKGCCDHGLVTQSRLKVINFDTRPHTNASLRMTFIKGTKQKAEIRLLSSC